MKLRFFSLRAADLIIPALGVLLSFPVYFLFANQFRSAAWAAGFLTAGPILFFLLNRATELFIGLIARKPGANYRRRALVVCCSLLLIYSIYPLCLLQWMALVKFLWTLALFFAALYAALVVFAGLAARYGIRLWLPVMAAVMLASAGAAYFFLREKAEITPVQTAGFKPGKNLEGTFRIETRGISRPGTPLSPDAPLNMPVTVAENARLEFELGILKPMHVPGLRLQVLATGDQALQSILFQSEFKPGQVGWTRHKVGLEALAGMNTTLQFRILTGSPGAKKKLKNAIFISNPVVSADKPERPNVILLVFDAMRADALGCYGSQAGRTPQIDQLAGQGVKFEHALSASAWTIPSIASLLTSRLPSQNHVLPMADPRYQTLPQLLSREGIRTGAVIGNPVFILPFKFDKGFQNYQMLSYSQIAWRNPEHAVDQALKWIDQNRDTGFFLYLHVFDPHDPYLAPPPYYPKPAPRESAATIIETIRLFAVVPYIYRLDNNSPRRLSPREIAQLRGRYLAEVEYAGAQAGRLKQELKERGLWKNTVLIITSDHGETFQEHGYIHHGQNVYIEQLHVPLIFTGGPFENARISIPEPVSLMDIFPTVLEIMGMEIPSGAIGRSLVPALRGDGIEDQPVFSELAVLPDRFFVSMLKDDFHFIRTEQYKPRQQTRLELYDWSRDPGESDDLARSNPREAEQRNAEMRSLLNAIPDRAPQSSFGDFEKAVTDRLRSLGYLK